MERLTRKHFRPGNSVKLIKENLLIAMYDKLYEYEDLEEQGLLLKLPCKALDVLYWLHDGEIREVKVYAIIVIEDQILIHSENFGRVGISGFDVDKIGTRYFLTEAEAEKALEEMKGE